MPYEARKFKEKGAHARETEADVEHEHEERTERAMCGAQAVEPRVEALRKCQ